MIVTLVFILSILAVFFTGLCAGYSLRIRDEKKWRD